MSTAQMQRTQEKTNTWSSIFPNETLTEQQSTLFVKKLVAVAVSNIAYLRAIFPEHTFGDRCIEDLNLKILRDDSSCPGACQVIKWVKGCFDAIEKKYLRMLIIGIYVDPEDPDTVIESYTFKFSYTNNGESGIDIYRNEKKISSAYSAAETKKATIRLLRTIVVLTQTLKSLPDDVMMTMKLLYYDDVTPNDYEPPGFKAAQSDNFHFDEEPMNIKVGDVVTPFHSIKMRIKTDKSQFEMKDEDAEENNEETIETTNITVTDNLMEDNTQEIAVDKVDEYEFKDVQMDNHSSKKKPDNMSPEAVVPSESPEVPGSNEMAVDTTGSQRSQESETADLGVRCPCGVNEDDGLMILCAVCKYWQHGICFLIKDENEAPETHFCDVCSEENNPEKPPTDSYLCGLSSVNVQGTCLWRRTLTAIPEMNRILAPNLAKRLGVEVNVAQGLMNRLEKEGFIKSSGKNRKLGKVVDKEKLKVDGYKKYLVRKKKEKELENLPMTDVTNTENESSKPQKKDLNKSIEQLATLTGDIELSRPKKKGRKNKQKQLDTNEDSQDITTIKVPDQPKKSRKRAISKVDEAEFDIVDSQMDSQDFMEERTSSKKKKASIVSKAIMV